MLRRPAGAQFPKPARRPRHHLQEFRRPLHFMTILFTLDTRPSAMQERVPELRREALSHQNIVGTGHRRTERNARMFGTPRNLALAAVSGLVPRSSSFSRSSALAQAVVTKHALWRPHSADHPATGQSCASPPVNRLAIRCPLASANLRVAAMVTTAVKAGARRCPINLRQLTRQPLYALFGSGPVSDSHTAASRISPATALLLFPRGRFVLFLRFGCNLGVRRLAT
jgi:hypothetical protein